MAFLQTQVRRDGSIEDSQPGLCFYFFGEREKRGVRGALSRGALVEYICTVFIFVFIYYGLL